MLLVKSLIEVGLKFLTLYSLARTAKMPGRWLMNPHRNILDYQLLTNFLTLSHTERRELAKQIGTTPSQIVDDLMSIQKAMMIF